jgi:hypothetical protein
MHIVVDRAFTSGASNLFFFLLLLLLFVVCLPLTFGSRAPSASRSNCIRISRNYCSSSSSASSKRE